MRRLSVLACVAAAGAVAMIPAGATAEHGCNGVVHPLGVGYIDDRDGNPWIYAETNNTPGLQSGGSSPTTLYEDEDCNHPNPDQLIF